MTRENQQPKDGGGLAGVRALLKSDGPDRALAELQTLLRRDRLPPEELDACGRFVRRVVRQHSHLPMTRWRLRLAGQCTTAWLANAVTAVAWREGFLLEVSEAEFDNVLQDAAGLPQTAPQAAGPAQRPDVLCFLPWLRNPLFADATAAEARARDEFSFWQQVWRYAQASGARILQVGCDTIHVGPAGYHLSGASGNARAVERLNESLRRELPEGSYFVDLPLLAGQVGRLSFYDPRRFAWTKQPFSEAGCALLAEHVVAGLRAMLLGPKKVLVLDLDNTLWGGVVGETGPHGIGLGETPEGEAFREFQGYVKGLAQRGVVLAVASKNNPDDARGPFLENPGMLLRLEDIACFEANWGPKAESLRRIAKTLNLGLESFVFFDDNPAEREHVRQALPQVTVANVPTEPAEYVRALEAGLWFETVNITAEDTVRVEQYRAESRRSLLRQESPSLDDYLLSLDMTARVAEIDDADLPRVVQLLGKTNQFNLTTRRHSAEDVRRLLAAQGSIGMTVRLSDRFGDYGLVAVVLAVPAASQTLVIDTFLMSCRVIGRSLEHFIGRELARAARQLGYRRVVGVYRPTAKNALVADLYPRLGFSALPAGETPAERHYSLDLARDIAIPALIRAA